ncbi:MAG: hypothetical protein KBT34_05015 [Prevotella sp.]|nr:hypothetical protein [Candidatus Prevotella equi]
MHQAEGLGHSTCLILWVGKDTRKSLASEMPSSAYQTRGKAPEEVWQ